MTVMSDIKTAAHRAVTGKLDAGSVEEVRVEPALGSDGEEVLRIVIVLKEGAIDRIDGEKFVDTLVSIKNGVRGAGDERLAIVEYATASELADNGDPES